MPDFNSVQLQNLVTQPAVRNKANQDGGRIRFKEFVYVAPASGTAPAIADRIIWGKLPPRSRVLGYLSRLTWTTGTASCTLNLGDNLVAARHLAATAITTAGSATPAAADQVVTAVGDITIGSTSIANFRAAGAAQVGSLITGTGIPTGTRITGVTGPIGGVCVVTISAAATATTASLAITVTGSAFETSDETGNPANAFVSTFDDTTLISTVAGAQIANNQVLTLKVAYVQD
jgi:hypothetical protein